MVLPGRVEAKGTVTLTHTRWVLYRGGQHHCALPRPPYDCAETVTFGPGKAAKEMENAPGLDVSDLQFSEFSSGWAFIQDHLRGSE